MFSEAKLPSLSSVIITVGLGSNNEQNEGKSSSTVIKAILLMEMT